MFQVGADLPSSPHAFQIYPLAYKDFCRNLRTPYITSQRHAIYVANNFSNGVKSRAYMYRDRFLNDASTFLSKAEHS